MEDVKWTYSEHNFCDMFCHRTYTSSKFFVRLQPAPDPNLAQDSPTQQGEDHRRDTISDRGRPPEIAVSIARGRRHPRSTWNGMHTTQFMLAISYCMSSEKKAPSIPGAMNAMSNEGNDCCVNHRFLQGTQYMISARIQTNPGAWTWKTKIISQVPSIN